MISGEDSLSQKAPFVSPSRYARVQRALADASDDNVRLWLTAAEEAADNPGLPAAARHAAHIHAAACRDLLVQRSRGRSNRAATEVTPDGGSRQP